MIYLLLPLMFCEAAPEASLIEPLPRENMNYLTISPPCGGVGKGRSHFLSEPNSLNPVTWKIVTPSSGKCSLRLSYGTDFSTYHTLTPTDNSTDSMGWFVCGEKEGIESKIFKFPEGITCDSCTLQWIWENKVATYYQCSDIEITGGKDNACYGKCKNAGFCSDGLCVCEEGWAGTFCEVDVAAEPVNILRLFIVLMVLVVVVALLSYLVWIRAHMRDKSVTERLFLFRKLRFCLPEEELSN